MSSPWEEYGNPWEEYGGNRVEDSAPTSLPPSRPVQAALSGFGNMMDLAPVGPNMFRGAAGELAHTATQFNDWTNPIELWKRATGQQRFIQRPEVQAVTNPQLGSGGGTGRLLAQGAELMLPAGLLGEALKGAPLAARIGAQALAQGAGAAAQSEGDPLATSVGLLGGAAGEGLATAAPAIARGLLGSARKEYGQVLGATTKGNKYLSATEVAPGMLERGIRAMTTKGLQMKVGRQLQTVGQAIGEAWESLPPGSRIPLDAVASKIYQGADEALTIATKAGPVPMGPVAESGLKTAQNLASTLRSIAEVNPETGVLEVSVERLRSLRQFWDKIAAKAGRYEGKALADESTAEMHGMAADAIRVELGKEFPNIAALNKEYAFWKDANKVITDTIMRRQGQAKPLGQKLARAVGIGAGMATGGIHGAVLGGTTMDALEVLTTSPAWRTVSATWKNDFAKALASGQTSRTEWLLKSALAAGAASFYGAAREPAPNGLLLQSLF